MDVLMDTTFKIFLILPLDYTPEIDSFHLNTKKEREKEKQSQKAKAQHKFLKITFQCYPKYNEWINK